ncbi:hypothetical protein [Clostridium hydrogenum]|uniref:hypothetical protein n=1 Tax=Clostridium hydrogenum TaxID=2855764 RepID=UPI001F3E8FC6|nr:hypothetical protein [Clostridium hydrogenum]
MNTKDFFELDTAKRVIIINKLLEKYTDNSLKNVSSELNISYSTFCKEMSKDDYVYIKRDNKYYKFIKDNSFTIQQEKNLSEQLLYIKNNFDKFKKLIEAIDNNYLVLDKRIYSQSDKILNKNIKINSLIYDEFTSVCSNKYPFLKLQDIISQCLLDFLNKNK